MNENIKITGFKELQDTFKKLDGEMQKDFIIKFTNETYKKAKKAVSKHSKSGKMEHNLYKKIKGLEGEVGIDDDGMMQKWRGKKINYALFVHFGSREHEIKPKDKKALRWVSDGKFKFAKKVHHPGYKGDPFLYKALDDTSKEVNKTFQRFIDGL